jgi:hypothetical protein
VRGGLMSAIIGTLQTRDEEPTTDHQASTASASYQEHELACMESGENHHGNF